MSRFNSGHFYGLTRSTIDFSHLRNPPTTTTVRKKTGKQASAHKKVAREHRMEAYPLRLSRSRIKSVKVHQDRPSTTAIPAWVRNAARCW
jgi:hypothetical protein